MLMVNALAGCLAGSTVINVNRAKKGSKMTIEKIVKQFNNEKVYYTRSDNGATVSMRPWNLSIPTYIASDYEGVVKLSRLKNAWFSGIKETYELTTETGRNIRATSIHPFLTSEREWVELRNLSIGDYVCVNVGQGLVSKVKEDKLIYPYCLTIYHPYQISNGNCMKVAKHRLVVEASMNNMNFARYIWILRNDRNLSGQLRYLDKDTIIHHKDKNTYNCSLDNLEVTSFKEHHKYHDWGNNVLQQIGTDRIVNIALYGKESTYDLEVETEPHNFIANDFVVHNTGKTTTGLWGLGVKIPKGIKISEEQREIVKEMRKYKGSQAAMAFNKTIADELALKVPQGCTAATANAFGHRAWGAHIGSRAELDALKNRKLCREFTQHIAWKERLAIEIAVDELVSLCKCYFFDPTIDTNDNWIEGDEYVDGIRALNWLAERFTLDITPQIIEIVQKVFTKGVNMKTYIDFDDQVFMPLFYDISLPRYGHLLVDEVQDLNRAKQMMALQMGEQLTCIGDRNQAIYGFAGADSEAMDNLLVSMGEDAIELPLNTTRRCPKSVVALAKKLVPGFRAAPDAKDGMVEKLDHDKFLKEIVCEEEPSMIVCRINAPLTSLAFKMIANGKRCYIQGRDIGRGLKSEIKKTGENNLEIAKAKAYEKIEKKKMEILGRDFPDEAQVEALRDRWNCIATLADNVDTVDEYFAAVDRLFKDSGSPLDTRLSSCHKAKGLEHKRVLIYQSNLLGRVAKKAYQTQQEKNLEYVSYTRSLDYLGLIPAPKKRMDDFE